MSTARAAALPFPSLTERQRDLIHWMLVFVMVVSSVLPALTSGVMLVSEPWLGTSEVPAFSFQAPGFSGMPVQADGAGRPVELTRAPYLPGRAPDVALPASPAPAAQRASTPSAPITTALEQWRARTIGTDRTQVVPVSEPSAALGTTLLPDWMAEVSREPAAVLGTALLPDWAGSWSGIDEGAPGTWRDEETTRTRPERLALPAWSPVVGGGDFAASGVFGLHPLLQTQSTADEQQPGPIIPNFSGGASCTPASALNITLTIPPYVVSRGNEWGDVYTVTVANNGAVSTTAVSLRIDPNVGFYYLGDSATVEKSGAGVLTSVDTGTGAPNAIAWITVTGDITQTSLLPGEVMTFTFLLATDANAISAQTLAVDFVSGHESPQVCKGTIANIQTGRGNLLISKDPGFQSAGFGDTVTWTVTLENNGLFGTVYGIQVVDLPGAGITALDVGSLPGPTNPLTLPSNAVATFVVTGTVGACSNLSNSIQAWWNIGGDSHRDQQRGAGCEF